MAGETSSGRVHTTPPSRYAVRLKEIWVKEIWVE
jgi:hypothetical protein